MYFDIIYLVSGRHSGETTSLLTATSYGLHLHAHISTRTITERHVGGDAGIILVEITLAICRRHELCCKLYLDGHEINVKACEAGPIVTGCGNIQHDAIHPIDASLSVYIDEDSKAT